MTSDPADTRVRLAAAEQVKRLSAGGVIHSRRNAGRLFQVVKPRNIYLCLRLASSGAVAAEEGICLRPAEDAQV